MAKESPMRKGGNKSTTQSVQELEGASTAQNSTKPPTNLSTTAILAHRSGRHNGNPRNSKPDPEPNSTNTTAHPSNPTMFPLATTSQQVTVEHAQHNALPLQQVARQITHQPQTLAT